MKKFFLDVISSDKLRKSVPFHEKFYIALKTIFLISGRHAEADMVRLCDCEHDEAGSNPEDATLCYCVREVNNMDCFGLAPLPIVNLSQHLSLVKCRFFYIFPP